MRYREENQQRGVILKQKEAAGDLEKKQQRGDGEEDEQQGERGAMVGGPPAMRWRGGADGAVDGAAAGADGVVAGGDDGVGGRRLAGWRAAMTAWPWRRPEVEKEAGKR